jgi:DNA primase catalytic core
MIPQYVIERILELDIVSVFRDEGIELKRAGSRYQCCCPFHNEKTPSFSVNANNGLYFCFGCKKGGNCITFIMEYRNMTYIEAIEYLAAKNGIEYEKREPTAEEIERRFKRDQLYQINRIALDFFIKNIESPIAKDYIKKRGWNVQMQQDFQIGYAPGNGTLIKYFHELGWNDDKLLLEAGVIKRDEETGRYFDAFGKRLIFPVFSRTGNILGFQGRYIGQDEKEKKVAKYLNTSETEIFKKKEVLFGFYQAQSKIRATETAILCEGNPDVIRLHQIGQTNALAPMGTALTTEQIEKLKAAKVKKIILIGDTDTSGIKATQDHGRALTEAGFNVRVTELPEGKDPDEYFLSHSHEFDACMSSNTTDYIPWIAARNLEGKSGQDLAKAITDICEQIACLSDENAAQIYLENLAGQYKGTRKIWLPEYHKAKNAKEREKNKDDAADKMLSKYGFYVKGNCYYGAGGNGKDKCWSNFYMVPILHIRDEREARRIFLIKNSSDEESVIKFKQSELVSFTDFNVRVESAGNFVWDASNAELKILKKYLYDGTPSADEIKQLGWQKKWGFYAWGNGGMDGDKFVEADKYGVIQIRDQKFYIPGKGLDTAENTNGYQLQRKFQYAGKAKHISMKEYSELLVKVFGDNAKVGLCFLLASLFKDIVTNVTVSFPILNLFGPKGTGKSALGQSLTAFFLRDNKPPNISNSTKAALAEAVAEVSNAVVHLDEYKNDLDRERREFIKGLWDGTGRSRMNLEDKKREVTAVDCGVVISGQEMPTADIAIFSRVLFCTFYKTVFSTEEKKNFENLRIIERRGLTHLTGELLTLRRIFKENFRNSWDAVLSDLNERTRNYDIEDRTMKNWATIVAAYKAVSGYVDFPFTYSEILDIAIRLCVEQNCKTKQSNELSGFWETIEMLVASNELWIKADYHIKMFTKPVAILESKYKQEFVQGKRYLCINFPRMAHLYAIKGRASDSKTIPRDTLRYYLEHSSEFIGTAKSMRFRLIENVSGWMPEDDGFGKSKVTTSMMFDYDALRENYGIDIDVSKGFREEFAEEKGPSQSIFEDDLPE